jgi:glycosyltransferase involved in cell wall biosynthesis
MKVLLAIPCLMRGGTEMQTLYLARALRESGHFVEVVCYFEHDKSVIDEFMGIGCTVSIMKLSRQISATDFVLKMKKYYQLSKPDVLHIQYMTPGALSIIAGKMAGIHHIIATVHQPYSKWHKKIWKIILRTVSVMCDYFISVSLNVEKSWFGSCSMYDDKSEKRHFTIYNTVDVELIEKLIKSDESLKIKNDKRYDDKFVFGYIGRLSKEKGVDLLVEAFEKLYKENNDVQLLIVGDGKERPELEAKYRSNLSWSNVVFLGRKSWDEAMKYLVLLDAVVVPSRFEGFGLTAIEAMAASKPVIAAKVGGLEEIIENNRSGLLYDAENTDDLARKMSFIIREKERRKVFSENARRRAYEFDVRRYNSIIKKLYDKLIV